MSVKGFTGSVVVTHWKNLKAFTVNPLEENKSFKSSSLTEELRDKNGKKNLISNLTLKNMWKNTQSQNV